MRDHEHSDACLAATERWRDRMIAPPFDKAVGLPTVIRNDPEAVEAWFTCSDITHESARRGFMMLARAVPANHPARAIAAVIGGG